MPKGGDMMRKPDRDRIVSPEPIEAQNQKRQEFTAEMEEKKDSLRQEIGVIWGHHTNKFARFGNLSPGLREYLPYFHI
ncbi:MAG: hypothetical protein WA133_01140 [Syntrophales bacterium]